MSWAWAQAYNLSPLGAEARGSHVHDSWIYRKSCLRKENNRGVYFMYNLYLLSMINYVALWESHINISPSFIPSCQKSKWSLLSVIQMTRLKRSCEYKLLTTPTKDKTEFNMKIKSPKLCKDIQQFKRLDHYLGLNPLLSSWSINWLKKRLQKLYPLLLGSILGPIALEALCEAKLVQTQVRHFPL